MPVAAPLTDSIAAAVSELVQQDRPPGHDQLNRLFARTGLQAVDPRRHQPTAGKLKRVRAVLGHAIDADPPAGSRLIALLLESVRAGGGFRPESPKFVGADALRNAQSAFRSEGFELEPDGTLRPVVLDNLPAAELGDALARYVRRARTGARDAALVTGTGKDLLEATARHIIIQRTGAYNERMGLPGTLYQAFELNGLATPSGPALQVVEQHLDENPQRRVEQTLYLLGCAVNRLRNAQGTGHGRPFPPTLTDAQATAAVEAMGVISELLLETQ